MNIIESTIRLAEDRLTAGSTKPADRQRIMLAMEAIVRLRIRSEATASRALYLGVLLDRLDCRTEAYAVVSSVARHRSDAEPLLVRALLQSGRGDYRPAKEDLEVAHGRSASPQRAYAIAANLAIVSAALGETGDALAWLEEARRLPQYGRNPRIDLALIQLQMRLDESASVKDQALPGLLLTATGQLLDGEAMGAERMPLLASVARSHYRATLAGAPASGAEISRQVMDSAATVALATLGKASPHALSAAIAAASAELETSIRKSDGPATGRALNRLQALDDVLVEAERVGDSRGVILRSTIAVGRFEYARLMGSQRQARAALADLQSAPQALEERLGVSHPYVITARMNAALAEFELAVAADGGAEEAAQALSSLRTAWRAAAEGLGSRHPSTVVLRRTMDVCAGLVEGDGGGRGRVAVAVRTRVALGDPDAFGDGAYLSADDAARLIAHSPFPDDPFVQRVHPGMGAQPPQWRPYYSSTRVTAQFRWQRRLTAWRHGWGWSMAGSAVLVAGWGWWATRTPATPFAAALLGLCIALAVGGGLFGLSRLVGRLVLEHAMGRVRRSAVLAHAVTGLFWCMVGVVYLLHR